MNRVAIAVVLLAAVAGGVFVIASQKGASEVSDEAPVLALRGTLPDDDGCTVDHLGARYEITPAVRTDAAHGSESRALNLYRDGQHVAIEDPTQGITEVWQRGAQGRLRLIRAFDADKRAVNYEPIEINDGRGERDWSLKSQLVSDSLLSTMKVESERGQGCDRLQHLSKEVDGGRLQVDFMPERKLMTHYEIERGDQRMTWDLKEVVGPAVAKAAVEQRLAYPDTDYADIGDNESDPFFRRMINLGFIEHGASGLYDAHGHELASQHGHGH